MKCAAEDGLPMVEEEETFLDMIEKEPIDLHLQRSVSEALLCIVRSVYWEMIAHGDFYGEEATIALSSMTTALSLKSYEVGDWAFIEPFCTDDEDGKRMSVIAAKASAARNAKDFAAVGNGSCLKKFLDSPVFGLIL